jgi:hypothetical protein
MKYFDARDDDPPHGNHGWVTAGNIPHERKNFLPMEDGRYLGFVQVKGAKINIDRLGADRDDDHVSGITVIWCAQHIDGRGIVVTGWYRNATVYRELQEAPKQWIHTDGVSSFRIAAPIADSQLVDASLRDFVVQPTGTPKSKGVFGMSDLAYVEERDSNLVGRLQAYLDRQVQAAEIIARGGGFAGGEVDPEQNSRVEQAAVNFVESHYVAKGWSVKDVSEKNLGWDVECRRGGKVLCIEIKGRTQSHPVPVALSRNERKEFERAASSSVWAERYRLAVVHDALSAPSLRIYRHTSSTGWRCELTSEGVTTQPLGLLIQPLA